jgi:S1-C subfamily serine protease
MTTSDALKFRLSIAAIAAAALLGLFRQVCGQAVGHADAYGNNVRIRLGVRGQQVAARPSLGPCGLVGGAREYGGTLDSPTGVLLTPPREYEREMIVPENVRWEDPRIVRVKGGGTGTIINVDGKPYVAMFAHGHAGKPPVQLGQRFIVQAYNGSRFKTTVAAVDVQSDCSLLDFHAGYHAKVPAMRVATSPPSPGDRVRTAGFPMSQELRDRLTQVLEATAQEIHIAADSIQGDSGAPVVNEDGELVGILVSGRITKNKQKVQGSFCCGPGPIQKLIRGLRRRLTSNPAKMSRPTKDGSGTTVTRTKFGDESRASSSRSLISLKSIWPPT